MSILNSNPNREEIPKAKRIAERIKSQTVQNYQNFLGIHEEGIRNFWHNSQATPQEIAAELGTSAVEIFSIHYKLGEFLKQFNPAKIDSDRSLIGSYTANEDGTITIN